MIIAEKIYVSIKICLFFFFQCIQYIYIYIHTVSCRLDIVSAASIRNNHIRDVKTNFIVKHQKHFEKNQICEQGVD